MYIRQEQYYTALMILIGNVVRVRPHQDTQNLLRLLRESISTSTNGQISASPTSNENEISSSTILNEPMPLASEEEDRETSRYTSILKEKGDVAGFLPEYNYEKVSDIPSIHKAVVSVHDYVFEGQGRTRQRAKHMASREACTFLGLVQ